MGITNILNLSRDAMLAQAYALDVTGQNVTNAATPGYVKRNAILVTKEGGGVSTAGVQRNWDQFLASRYTQAASLSSAASQRDDALASIEAITADLGDNGIGSSVGALFNSFASLASTPNDATARNAVLSRASDLASRFNAASKGLQSARADLLSQASGIAAQITSKASQIAHLNGQIVVAKAAGSDVSNLEDQRDSLVSDIAQQVDVQTLQDSNGRYILRASGTTLVEADSAGTMTIGTSASGSMEILVQRAGGAPVDTTNGLTGGKLAGLREARDVDAVQVGNSLDQLAWDVGSAINTQHAAGYGLDGSTGKSLFSLGGTVSGAAANMQLDAQMDGHPERVAASSSAGLLPGGSDNAVALGQLSGSKIAGGGTKTAADAWADFVGDVGLRKSSAAKDASIRQDLTAQTKAMQDSSSGVSVDEEMINLTKYQRSYEAAAKLLRTADDLLGTLMQEVQ